MVFLYCTRQVDINGLIHGLQRVQLARGARNGSQKVPDPLPPPEEELEHVKITGVSMLTQLQ